MGIELAVFGLVAGTTVLQASAARNVAEQRNDAIERSQQSLTASTVALQQQLTDSAALERRKVALNAAQIEGRIRAARATAGQGMSGTTLALIRQNDITEGENLNIIGTNLTNQIARVQSGFDAQAAQLSAGVVNEGLATLTGGLSGLSTGLSLTSGLMGISKFLNSTPANDPRGQFQPVSIL